MFTPVRFRLPFPTNHEASPATRCNTPKKCSSRLPSAFGRYFAKSSPSLRRCTPKKRSRQMAFGFWSIPCEKFLQLSEMSSGNTFTSGSLWLWVDPLRKTTQVACCDAPKKSSSRQPSALSWSSAENYSSSLLRCPEKVRLQTAFGFWSIPCKKSRQRPEICPEKTLRSDCLRLWIYTEQKASPAFGDVLRKYVHIRQPSAFGRYSAKGTSSVRRCIPKKRSRQAAFGFWSISCKKPCQPSEIYPGKMFTPVRFRLPFHTDREAP